MATIRLVPSTYSVSNTALTVSNVSNMYTNTDSTTYGTCTSTTTNSTRYIYLRGFNFDDVPSWATVNSFTVKIKANENNLSTNNQYRPYLVNNTTTLTGTFSTVNTTVRTLSCSGVSANWDTISGYGSNFGVRLTVRATTNPGTLNIYGAEILVDYEDPRPTYNVTASSSVQGISVSPASQTVYEGESATITFAVNDISEYSVTDNGTDVTDLLTRHEYPSGNAVDATPGANFTTGFSASNANFYMSSSSTGTTYLQYAIGKSAENPYSTSNTSNTYVKDGNNNTATGWIIYPFDFSGIPESATITNVSVKCYGARESSTTDSTHMAELSTYSGNTLKGRAQEFTSTNNNTITLSNVGTWTRTELQNAKLRFRLAYYGGRLLGVTWSVTYTTPSEHYYTYTISNVTGTHVVILEEAGAYVPPEEDPEKTYYSLTISSINANTDPPNGTTRVESGTSETITIYPTDPLLTLALDNGVDVTSQLIGGVPSNTYTITTQVTGASYGFNLNSNTGYYVSSNNGVSKSASVARLNMTFESDCIVTIQYINYAEANYDYGMFGKLDTSVATDGLTASSGSSSPSDSTSNYELAMCSNSSSAQTISYNVPAGNHYIDIKYGKDDATDSNNDTLQWKVLSVEATGAGGSYTYSLSNITTNHSLVFIFGNVSYYFINSSLTSGDARLFPDGQTVKLEGDGYRLTIIPDNTAATVTLYDNGVDSTQSLQYEEGQDKQGNLVVNYIYLLTNIQATHNLTVICTVNTSQLFVKVNGAWVQVAKAYKKINGVWEEQSDMSTVLDSRNNYAKGN